MPSRAALDAFLRSRAPAARAPTAADRALVDHLLIRTEDLLQSDAWATFRLHVDRLQAADTAAQAALREQLDSVDTVGDELLRLKLRAAQLRGRLEAWAQALALPGHLHEFAEAASKSLTASDGGGNGAPDVGA